MCVGGCVGGWVGSWVGWVICKPMQVCRFLLYCISGIEGNSRTLKILEDLNIRVKFTQGRVSDG